MPPLLVTVGSTNFRALTDFIVRPQTLLFLASLDLAPIALQHGDTDPPAQSLCQSYNIEPFQYASSLATRIAAAHLIISHAGAGSVLEALHARKRLLVVINDTLMHNHQTQLATRLASLNCCAVISASELEIEGQFQRAVARALQPVEASLPPRQPSVISTVVAEQLDYRRTR